MLSERSRTRPGRGPISLAAWAAVGIFLIQITQLAIAAETKSGVAVRCFAAADHVLEFERNAVLVASADHVLRIEFGGGTAVSPVVDLSATLGNVGAMPVPALGRVIFPGIWDGVTAVYEARPGTIFESSYRIEAGAKGNPVERIRLGYGRPVRIDAAGNLIVGFANGEMRESAPVAWQEDGRGRRRVPVAFRRLGANDVGFEVGDYDRDRPLVIDPALIWNTFLGGTGWDVGRSVAVDGKGNVYIAGYSDAAWGTPVRAYSGNFDAFVVKLDSQGHILWNTFLGGNGIDFAYGVAVDGNGNVYITGYGDSFWGAPVRSPSGSYDAFVAKLDSGGRLLWNTFLGSGSDDYGYGVAVDGNGNVLVAGYSTDTWGTPIIGYSAGYDAFAAKLDGNGNLLWNTFLGGDGRDVGRSVAVDGNGNVYVGGYSDTTWGTPVRGISTSYDAFAAELDGGGNLLWNTFLGGSGDDYGYGIAVDPNGYVYVAGTGNATWLTPVNAYTSGNDAFIVQLDNAGNLIWLTFLGGNGNDNGTGIALDSDGSIYISGSSDVTWGSPIIAFTSINDAFAAKVDGAGNVLWNTFLGGSGSDFGESLAVDGKGNVYLTGVSDATWGAPVRAIASKYDAFVTKIPTGPTTITLSSFAGTAGSGYIELDWTTTAELGTVGFNIWRHDPAGWLPEYVKLTASPIPSQGDASTGAFYQFLDPNVIAGQSYLYELEDIDGAGLSAFHGPITVVAGTILLTSPTVGGIGRTGTPPTFAWNGGAFTSFQLEFSNKADFTTSLLTVPSVDSWIVTGSYTPTQSEWRSIRRLGGLLGMAGNIYWRVRGKTAAGVETTSEIRSLIVLPGQ